MLAVMTEPDGPRSAAAREQIDAPLDHVVRSTPGLGAAERLELYRRGYRSRLVECMRATHPALRHALGDELFDAFAADYLAASPSRSHTLADLGAGFADHLAATRPDGDELWPEFVVELARLERAFLEVYDGHGAEGEQIASERELPAQPTSAWLAATVDPVPCLRLTRARFPVGAYLRAVRAGEEPELPPPADSRLALCRQDYVVTFADLDEPGDAGLQALLGGASVGEAAARAALDPEEMWRRVREWAGLGFFRALHPDDEQEPTR